MRTTVTILFFLISFLVKAQEAMKPLEKRWIVKTNVLSLIAQKPTFSVEKAFGKTYSAEVSFVQGKFNHILFTDHYQYHGYLVRVKRHLVKQDYGAISPYLAVYGGTLHRNIRTKGESFDASGFLGYSSRNFSNNSIRGGGSFGLAYFTKNRINIDGQASLGYGRYLHPDMSDPNTYSRWYPDLQLWASIGYCF